MTDHATISGDKRMTMVSAFRRTYAIGICIRFGIKTAPKEASGILAANTKLRPIALRTLNPSTNIANGA